jgi:probable rRNA maturation factor
MLNIKNLTTTDINLDILEEIAKTLTNREIDLTICDDSLIKEYNNTYRGINRATDVLSFPIESEFDNMPLGSIVISSDFVQKGAREFGHSIDSETALLFIHGFLHLLGYDHEIDGGEMREKEREIIHQFNLPKSLIVRTERV